MAGQQEAAIFQIIGILEILNFGVETYAKLTHNYFMKMMMNTTFLFTYFTAKANKAHAAKLNAQVFPSFQALTQNLLREVSFTSINENIRNRVCSRKTKRAAEECFCTSQVASLQSDAEENDLCCSGGLRK